ncbi:MAG: hypothetical protein GQ552_08895 [Flavobacteriaceae bacterium]|nr:hypothetical protein [Flavobacteriaceae bacterium]
MNPTETKHLIRKLLPNIPINGIDRILEISYFEVKENNEIISKRGNRAKKSFLILNGVVRGSFVTEKGIERNILLRSEGVFVADIDGAFNNKPQKLTFTSVGRVELLVFNFNEFEDLALKDPVVLKIYLGILKEALTRLSYRVESLTTMTIEERYLDLLRLKPKFLKSALAKHIANYLGITSVSLSRLIKRTNKKIT